MVDKRKKPESKKKSGNGPAPTTKEPRKAGRPSDFRPEIGTELCARIIELGSLRKVCAADDMPDKATVFRWLAKSDEDKAPAEFVAFRDQYVRARKLAKDFQFDEHWEDVEQTAYVPVVVDDVPLLDGDGKVIKIVTPQSVALARLKHDAFKWQSSKEDPKKYGDRQEVEHSGKVESTPPTFIMNFSGKPKKG